MRESSISKKKGINWKEFEVPKLHLKNRKTFDWNSYISCGSAALSLITGISTKTIEKSCPNPSVGWYTSRVIKYLKEKGFTVIELSKKDVLNSYCLDFPINKNHCLLMNVRMDNSDNTMFVVHKGKLWHHYECEPYFNNLFFINKPTQDVLLIFKKDWK